MAVHATKPDVNSMATSRSKDNEAHPINLSDMSSAPLVMNNTNSPSGQRSTSSPFQTLVNLSSPSLVGTTGGAWTPEVLTYQPKTRRSIEKEKPLPPLPPQTDTDSNDEIFSRDVVVQDRGRARNNVGIHGRTGNSPSISTSRLRPENATTLRPAKARSNHASRGRRPFPSSSCDHSMASGRYHRSSSIYSRSISQARLSGMASSGREYKLVPEKERKVVPQIIIRSRSRRRRDVQQPYHVSTHADVPQPMIPTVPPGTFLPVVNTTLSRPSGNASHGTSEGTMLKLELEEQAMIATGSRLNSPREVPYLPEGHGGRDRTPTFRFKQRNSVPDAVARARRASAPAGPSEFVKSNVNGSNLGQVFVRACTLPMGFSLRPGVSVENLFLVSQVPIASNDIGSSPSQRTSLSPPRSTPSLYVKPDNRQRKMKSVQRSVAKTSSTHSAPKFSLISLRQNKQAYQEDDKARSGSFFSQRRRASKVVNTTKIGSDADDTDSMSSPPPLRRRQERERGRSRTVRSRKGSPPPAATTAEQEIPMRSSTEGSSLHTEQKMRDALLPAQDHQSMLKYRPSARQTGPNDQEQAPETAAHRMRRKSKRSLLTDHHATNVERMAKNERSGDGAEITLCLDVRELPRDVQVSSMHVSPSVEMELAPLLKSARSPSMGLPLKSTGSADRSSSVDQLGRGTNRSSGDLAEALITTPRSAFLPEHSIRPMTALRVKVSSGKLSSTIASQSATSTSCGPAAGSSRVKHIKTVSPTWWLAKDSERNLRRQILTPLKVPKHRRLDSGVKLGHNLTPAASAGHSVSSTPQSANPSPKFPRPTVDCTARRVVVNSDPSNQVKRASETSPSVPGDSSPDDVASIFSLYMDLMIGDITAAATSPTKADTPTESTSSTPTLRESLAGDIRLSLSRSHSSDSHGEGTTSSMSSSQYTTNNDSSIDGSNDDDSDNQTIHAPTPVSPGFGFRFSLIESMAANLLSPWSPETDAEPLALSASAPVAKQTLQVTVEDNSLTCPGSVARFSWESTEDFGAPDWASESPERKACTSPPKVQNRTSTDKNDGASQRRAEEVQDIKRATTPSASLVSERMYDFQIPELNIVPSSEAGTPRSPGFPRSSIALAQSVATTTGAISPLPTSIQRGDSTSGNHSRTQVDDFLDKLCRLNGYTRNMSPHSPKIESAECSDDDLDLLALPDDFNPKLSLPPFMTKIVGDSKQDCDFRSVADAKEANFKNTGESERVKSWQSLNLLPIERFGSDRASRQSRLRQVAAISDDSESDHESEDDEESSIMVTESVNKFRESDTSEDDSSAEESDDSEPETHSGMHGMPSFDSQSNHSPVSESDDSDESSTLQSRSSHEQQTVTLATDVIAVIPIRPESIRSITIQRSPSSQRATTSVASRDSSLSNTRIQERLKMLPPLDTKTRSSLMMSHVVADMPSDSSESSLQLDQKELFSSAPEIAAKAPAHTDLPELAQLPDNKRRSKRTFGRASRHLRLLRKVKKMNRKSLAVRVTSVRTSKADLLSVLAATDTVNGAGERSLTRIPLKLVAPQPKTSDIMQLQQKPNVSNERSSAGGSAWAATTLDLIHQWSRDSRDSTVDRSTKHRDDGPFPHTSPSTTDTQWEDVDDTDRSRQGSVKLITPAATHPAILRVSPQQPRRSQPQTPASDVVPFQTFASRLPPPSRPAYFHLPGPPPRGPPPPPPSLLPPPPPSVPPPPPPKDYSARPLQPKPKPSIASVSTVHPSSSPTTLPTPSTVATPSPTSRTLDWRQLVPPPAPPQSQGYQRRILRSDSASIAVSTAPAPEIPRHNPNCPMHGKGSVPRHPATRFRHPSEDLVHDPSCPVHGAPTTSTSRKKPPARARFFASSKTRRASVRVDWDQASRIAAAAAERREATLAAEAAAAKKRHEDLQELMRVVPRGDSVVGGEVGGGSGGTGRRKARKREVYRLALKVYGFV